MIIIYIFFSLAIFYSLYARFRMFFSFFFSFLIIHCTCILNLNDCQSPPECVRVSISVFRLFLCRCCCWGCCLMASRISRECEEFQKNQNATLSVRRSTMDHGIRIIELYRSKYSFVHYFRVFCLVQLFCINQWTC